MTSSIGPRARTAFLAVAATFALLTLAACGGGGGGGGPTSMIPSGGSSDTGDGTGSGGTGEGSTPSGSDAAYTVSADGGTFGSTPVTVSAAALTVGNRTIRFDSASQVGDQAGHYRAFDSAAATSGPATEVHVFDHTQGYEHLQFGSWAEGEVRPNPGFYISDTYGAFVAPAPSSDLTRPANVPTAGSATFDGEYTGYVYKQGVGTSHVVGDMTVQAQFQSNPVTGSSGIIIAQLLGADPHRSTFATPEIRAAALSPGNDRRSYGFGYGIGYVRFIGALDGAQFEVDPNATYTITTPLGAQTFQRGDQIYVEDGFLFGGPSNPNTGQLTGGFFGPNANEAGGTYQFSTGSTHAAGSFGSRRTD